MKATTVTEQLVEDYLDQLATATRTLPSAQQAEILAEIKEHIRVTLSPSEEQSETAVRNVLDRLGAPEDIAREAGAGASGQTTERRRVHAFEVVTVILLLIGGIVLPVLGWVIGAVLLWSSGRWTTRDKVIGTLVLPGGLLTVAWYFLFWSASSVCSPDGTCQTSGLPAGVALTLALAGAVGPIATAGYLLRRATR